MAAAITQEVEIDKDYQIKDDDLNLKIETGAKVVIVDLEKSSNLKISVEEGASATIITLHQGKNSCTREGEVKRNGTLKWIDFFLGKEPFKYNLKTYLKEAGAAATKLQAFLGTDLQEIEISSEVIHEHSNTNSLMKAKVILSGQAKANYQGKIKIAKKARGCSAHQRTDTLLLGEEAKCSALPILEVENDDVNCSHGASLGQIDEEQLFYLLSRGLNENQANKLIISGFLEPIIKQIDNQEIQNKIIALIEEKTDEFAN